MRDTVAARNPGQNFLLRNGGALAALRATIENSLASDSSGDLSGGGGFLAMNGARVTVRNSAAVRNEDGFRAHATAAGTTTELYLDHCLAAENSQGVLSGDVGAGSAVITVSNSTSVRNVSNGISAGTNGTVRSFANTVTNNGTGINGQNGTFESAGNNMVRGNTVETNGAIIPIGPM